MGLKVLKFGGSSLADAEQFKKVAEIIKSEPERRYVIASAPGKRNSADTKVTDLLYKCYELAFNEEDITEVFDEIKTRYNDIIRDLGIDLDLTEIFEKILASIRHNAGRDYIASRGEYLNAKVIAEYFGYEFLDATKFVRFKKGELDLVATMENAKRIDGSGRYVIPGFYGLDERRHIKTFSRGGSDITGSIVARVFSCDLYENWTDVDGIYVSDPKVIENSKKVGQVSFRELREMSYMGASVLHAETLLPIYDKPIPIVIKNSFDPEAKGTQILKKRTEVSDKQAITCITGKNDYTCIQISKMMLDKELGFVKKVTSVFEEYNINISHTHSGLDNLCFFVEHSEYKEIAFEDFVKELKARINADRIKGHEKIALLAVIGHNLSGKVGILAKIFKALKENKINVKTIYQSISECNIIIGIEDHLLKDSIKAVYKELIGRA